MTRAERIRELQDEYARRRRQNEIEQQEREREAFARDPELARLREESISLAVRSMREAMREEDAQKRRAIAEAMRSGGLRINAEMRLRLQNLGLAEDYLEERYRCPVCRDTGYVGDAPARFCECFERRLTAMGMRPGLRALLILMCLLLAPFDTLFVYYGMFSALFGQTYGVVTNYLKKRHADRGDGDDFFGDDDDP